MYAVTFVAIIILATVFLSKANSVTRSFFTAPDQPNCYQSAISAVFSASNLALSLLLLIAGIANTVAASFLVSVLNEYFHGNLQEERRQLSIVFGIFSATVIVVMVISFTIGHWGTIVPNSTVRADEISIV